MLEAAWAAAFQNSKDFAAAMLHAGSQFALLTCVMTLLLVYELCEVNILAINFHSNNSQVLRKQP